MCKITEAFLVQVAAARRVMLKWKINVMYVNRKERKILLKIISGKEIGLQNASGLFHKTTSAIKHVNHIFLSQNTNVNSLWSLEVVLLYTTLI